MKTIKRSVMAELGAAGGGDGSDEQVKHRIFRTVQTRR